MFKSNVFKKERWAMWGSAFFVALNLIDAWLTKQAFALGDIELNPIVSHFGYGDNLVIKGLIAVAIALTLWHFGKAHLLKYLNILMLVLICWNTTMLVLLRTYC